MREEADRWSNDAWRSGRGKGGRTGILAERGRNGPPMAQARWEDAPAGALTYEGHAGRKQAPVSNFLSKDRDSAGREGDWRSKAGGMRAPGDLDGSRHEPGLPTSDWEVSAPQRQTLVLQQDVVTLLQGSVAASGPCSLAIWQMHVPVMKYP